MSKVIKTGKTGNYILIGENEGNAVWYTIPTSVKPYTKDLQVGDEVTVTSKVETKPVFNGNGRTEEVNVATRIMKGNVASHPSAQTSTPTTHVNKWSGEKSTEVQASIRSQAIGHMITRTLIALQGHVTPDNVSGLIDNLKVKYESIV